MTRVRSIRGLMGQREAQNCGGCAQQQYGGKQHATFSVFGIHQHSNVPPRQGKAGYPNGTDLESASTVMRAADFETNWVSQINPATVTVPAWFTLGAARKVAAAKGVSEVAFYDQRGSRTTVPLAGLLAIPASRLLANCCHPAEDLQARQAA